VDVERVMISLPTMLDQRLKAAVPEKTAWAEAWGFLLLGIGVFLALACYSFSPYDYGAHTGILNPHVSNLAGPVGALGAAHVLGRFGVVGLVWPIAFICWGALTATGFVLVPRPRRFLGLVVVTADVAGYCELLLPRTGLPEPAFGFGGVIGQIIRRAMVTQMGFGGTLIALAIAGVVILVLSGNLRISRTAEYAQEGAYIARRAAKKAWVRHILNEGPLPVVATAPMPAAAHGGGGGAPRGEAPAPAPVAAAPAPRPANAMDLYYDGPSHGRPDVGLFARTKKAPDRSADFKSIAENLTTQLAEFKINGEIKAVTQGPVVTTFEFKPAPGTKVSKISALGEDLARLLKAQSLRVLAPIPGKDTVGFEVPNTERAVIGFADLIDVEEFRSKKRRLPIAMGVDIFGAPIVEDLAEMPHLLVAGSTGSGKSVFMNTLIGSLIARHTAKDLRFIMIDPKMVEMAAYNILPHMACPVITDPQTEARAALSGLVIEMDDRYRRMRCVGARNIESYNEIIKTRKKTEFLDFEGKWQPMPYVVLIIDELADMMMLLGKDAETPITRLAQKARAAGIHMVIATQRPSADVVTGLIKANFPTRVAFRVMSGIDSRTILDQNGAETLLGKGDMLYMASGGARRLHGAYLHDSEVQAMVKASAKKSDVRR
jgi:S-DNA-T family DNA segregation ATPase FtsK/SpoIIIE